MALKDYLNIIRKPKRVGRPPKEATRETLPWPNLSLLGQNPSTQAQRVVYKATPRNLRYFSNMPIPRRAINAIRNPLTQLDWEVVPNTGVTMNSEIERQIEAVTTCLRLPNDDDSFDSLLTQLVDDICCGAGVMEIGLTGYPDRPVFLWPVDGLSVHIYPGWRGGKNEARYLQTIGYGGGYSVGFTPGVKLRDDEIIYLRPNATTASPFGFGPMEVAFSSIANQLATAKFSAKLAGNALPPFMLDLGEVTSRVVQSWRSYWTNDIEGEGKIPIVASELSEGQAGVGKTRGAAVLKLYPEGDKALYLQYQEFLRTEIAAAFDISNMSLNVERDVNRSTAETMEDREWVHAIRPMARLIAGGLTRKVIWGALGFTSIHFGWKGVDRENLDITSQIHQRYYSQNVYTPNDIRHIIGLPPATNAWGSMTKSDADIAVAAAKGVGEVLDKDLGTTKKQPPPPAVGPAKPHPAGYKPKADLAASSWDEDSDE